MAYDYSSENKRLELPNPYRLQNLWLWLCALLLIAGGVLCFWWTRQLLQAEAVPSGIVPLLAGVVLLGGGLISAAVAAKRLRFFFGRGRPVSLADELQPGMTGGSKRANALKEILRQGGLTYPEPQGALDGILYHWLPQLITAPLEVQARARRHFFNLVALIATTLSFAVSWLVLGDDRTRPWIGVLYFVFGAVFLLRPVLRDSRASLSMASVIGLFAAAILAPVLIGLVGHALPPMDRFSLSLQAAVMLGTGLVAVVLIALAVRAQIGTPPAVQSRGEQHKLSMNAPPGMLLDELERKLQDEWTEGIPNRRYARLEPLIDPARSTGPFAGELLEETQPLPLSGTVAPTLGSALANPMHRWLLVVDIYATLLVATAVGLMLYFVSHFHRWEHALHPLSLASTSVILLLMAVFCFKGSAALWGRFNFESVLLWVELAGTFQRSRVGTGNQLTSRLNTDSEVIRTEAMTLRVWRARIESVVFGKDGQRQITAMFSTTQEARDLVGHLVAFARSQSVLVAPGSAEDEVRIQALNAGERALAVPAAPAAQLHHDIQAMAALTQAPAEPAGTAPAAARFCTECGAALPPGARFCASCGAPVAAG